jgi:hypothetical protein
VQSLHISLNRLGENSGALLPPHSMKAMRDVIG